MTFTLAQRLALSAFVTFVLAGELHAHVPTGRPVTGQVIVEGVAVTGGVQEDVKAPHTAAGRKSTFDTIRFVKRTNRIPANLGVAFGFEYQLTGLPVAVPLSFEIRAIHPPLTGKDGKVRTISTAQMEVFSDDGTYQDALIYRLSEPYEVVPGRWILEMLFEGKQIFSREFILE